MGAYESRIRDILFTSHSSDTELHLSPNENNSPHHAELLPLLSFSPEVFDLSTLYYILFSGMFQELTDEWDSRGVKQGVEYAILTDEITKAWSGMTTRQYKNLKGLKKENLRDNMSTLELVLNMLAEATTTEISKEKNPQSFSENRSVAKEGGEVAGNARKDIEERTGKPVITSKNAVDFSNLISDVIENDFDKSE